MFAPKNILVPTDFSKYADSALKKAVDIATQHNTRSISYMLLMSKSINVRSITVSVMKSSNNLRRKVSRRQETS